MGGLEGQGLGGGAAGGGLGHGGGAGQGYDAGMGRGRQSHAPKVTMGQGQITGSLDKEIIRRYVKRHISEIVSCYEQQLKTKPDLAARLVVTFTIMPDGTVAKSKATGAQKELENCIASAFTRIEFPKPAGGGSVEVSYPFNFSPADE